MADSAVPPVLCFGEILWDCLPRGLFPGGAPINVAYHLQKLGLTAYPVTAVGSDVGAVRDVRRSFLEAAHVADAAAGQPGRPFHRLEDVRLRGLLHLLRDDARLQTFVEREVGALLAYDAQHRTALVPLLGTYLEHGRNKSAAADAAHLSRPAFYERLHRIERVLGVDLDSVDSCLSLQVALVARAAMQR